MSRAITAAQVRELFDYDPNTGVFRNATRRGNCVVVGAEAGHVNPKGYRVIKVLGRAHKAHKLAFLHVHGWCPHEVDHVNGAKDDNRIDNLRDGTEGVNARNRRKPVEGSASGLLGAHRGGWKKQRWVSDIRTNGTRVYLGIFPTAEAAHEAYMAAKRRLHPEAFT